MRIRAAESGDFPAIAALTNRFIRGTAIHFGYDPVTPEEMRTLWKTHADKFPWLVAEIGGAFAGYCKAGVWRDRAAYAWTPESGIYIEEGFRGCGVGRGLYLRLFDVLRAQGYHSLIGGMTLPNPASRRLHESVGFVCVGRVRQAGWKLGEWHDVEFWQKMLREDATPPERAGEIRPPRIEPVETE